MMPKALKSMKKLFTVEQYKQVLESLYKLENWPDCHMDIKALKNRIDYRLRLGNWRVIFEITAVSVIITEVKKRDENSY